MKLALLITLDPRKPSLIVYSNKGWGFSEQSSYLIEKGRRPRLNGINRHFNSNIKLATQLFNGIVKNSKKIDPSLVDTLPTSMLIKKLQSDHKNYQQVLLEVQEENSTEVLEYVNTFLAQNKIRNYDDQFKCADSPGKILEKFQLNPQSFGFTI